MREREWKRKEGLLEIESKKNKPTFRRGWLLDFNQWINHVETVNVESWKGREGGSTAHDEKYIYKSALAS